MSIAPFPRPFLEGNIEISPRSLLFFFAALRLLPRHREEKFSRAAHLTPLHEQLNAFIIGNETFSPACFANESTSTNFSCHTRRVQLSNETSVFRKASARALVNHRTRTQTSRALICFLSQRDAIYFGFNR